MQMKRNKNPQFTVKQKLTKMDFSRHLFLKPDHLKKYSGQKIYQ